jgi:hypothetical protein
MLREPAGRGQTKNRSEENMTEYAEGQGVKGKQPPSECPDGFYWRKTLGLDEFKLYRKKARQPAKPSATSGGAGEEPRLTVNRLAEGVRFHMQHEEGFKRVLAVANLSAKALQNLAAWSSAAATAKAEQEKVRTAALARANAALKDAGLMIGPDGAVKPIPTA